MLDADHIIFILAKTETYCDFLSSQIKNLDQNIDGYLHQFMYYLYLIESTKIRIFFIFSLYFMPSPTLSANANVTILLVSDCGEKQYKFTNGVN